MSVIQYTVAAKYIYCYNLVSIMLCYVLLHIARCTFCIVLFLIYCYIS